MESEKTKVCGKQIKIIPQPHRALMHLYSTSQQEDNENTQFVRKGNNYKPKKRK